MPHAACYRTVTYRRCAGSSAATDIQPFPAKPLCCDIERPGNISGEATPLLGNTLAEAMRTPTHAASAPGTAKIPAPTTILKMLAASPQGPRARTSPISRWLSCTSGTVACLCGSTCDLNTALAGPPSGRKHAHSSPNYSAVTRIFDEREKRLCARLEMYAGVLRTVAVGANNISDLQRGSGGPIWDLFSSAPGENQAALTNFPLFDPKRMRGAVLPPGRCGDGHKLTPANLVPAERGTRWRC
jgi:hypothetical protein